MSIAVKEVTKLYGEQRALNGVSFNIGKGEIVGFLGPNGAGKSTMMKIISCYIPPNSGQVKVCGFDVSEQSLQVRKKIGYLPEHNPLYTDMYVREYLTFVGGIYQLANARKAADDMIDLVGLNIEAHKKIEALSKGYRQRVGLAQAMIHQPEVLILDEPTSGLDPNQLSDIRQLILKIGEEKTVMLSTHIMQEVEALCSRAIIISRGNIVADEPIDRLRSLNAGSGYELYLELSGTLPIELIKKINGVARVSETGNNAWSITVHSQQDIRKDLADLAAMQGLSILSLSKKEQRLEDVFKELTTQA